MNPIISPAWIYLIHLTDTIYGLSIFALTAALIMLILLLISGIEFDEETESKRLLTNKWMKICVITIIVCMLMLVLVPDKKTMYAMMAASMITPENISDVENHVVDLITKIADAVYNTTR